MESRRELEAPPGLFHPCPHTSWKETHRREECRRPACGVMSSEEADFRNWYPRGGGEEDREPEKE